MAVETSINYFDLSNERVFYPGTAGYQRRKFDVKPISITDIRGREDDFTLEKNGFKVLKDSWSETDVNDDEDHIQNVVFPETIAAVKQAYVLPPELYSYLLQKLIVFKRTDQAPPMCIPSPTSSADTWPAR